MTVYYLQFSRKYVCRTYLTLFMIMRQPHIIQMMNWVKKKSHLQFWCDIR